MSKRRAHYCVRIANDICQQIALGNSLEKALAKVGTLAPSMPVFWRWLDEYPEFLEKYERARQMQADMHADRMLDMAAEVLKTPSKAAAVRVAVDILKWQAEIRDPKKYGTKVQHEHKPAAMKPEDLKKEILRLESELGVKATPAMNTAPRHIPQLIEATVVEFAEVEEAEIIASPPPAPKVDFPSTLGQPPNPNAVPPWDTDTEGDPANSWVHNVMKEGAVQ